MNKSDLQIDFKTVKLFREIAQIVAPPPILTVSQWADRYRKLSAESAAEPGQWNTDRAPYQREILDAVNDPACEEVVIMSSAQVGKTELILNTIGYYVDYDPAPILVVQPTLDMAQAFSKDRLAPMIRDLDTRLFCEFFQALVNRAGMNLHVRKMAGEEVHHVAEAVFKAFAKALDQAVTHDPRVKGVLSTKGSL